MRFARLVLLPLAALVAPATLAAQDPEPDQEIVVNGETARVEIERILNEDNLDGNRLSPREIADTMAGIARGRAPQDFWTAYQAHVEAWQRFASSVEQAGAQQGESSFGLEGEAAEAEQAISTTFSEVERIARRYGARLPGPRVNPLEIA
ncbi:MAG: hypothetical protein AB7O91_04610 [Sphingomonas sp.]